jgi:hypothetical protein
LISGSDSGSDCSRCRERGKHAGIVNG